MISEQQLDLFIGVLATEQSNLSAKLNDPSNTDVKRIMADLKDLNQLLTMLYKLSEKMKKRPKENLEVVPQVPKKKRSK